MTVRITVRDIISEAFDEGSFEPWDDPALHSTSDPEYAAALASAQARSGSDESVVSGTATIGGHRVAVIINNFDFLGGSIGVVAADRLIAAFHRATARNLPVIAFPSSGGTRMQDGTPAFVKMIEITTAVDSHKAAALPFAVYLRHPTTGGTFASWGSLGHITFAQPGALIGFIGPRVLEVLHGTTLPADVQRAENLARRGLIDGIASVTEFSAKIDAFLNHTERVPLSPASLERTPEPARTHTPWESVGRSREHDRPGIVELLEFCGSDAVVLRDGRVRPPMVSAVTSFFGQPCMVIGQDRSAQAAGALIGPSDLADVRRVASIAEDLELPVVLVIDTPGAELSENAENHGIAVEIARCVSAVTRLRTPTLSVLLGEGGGGGALALFGGDRAIALEHAWLSPLPPEGASALSYGTTSAADQISAQQQITAFDLRDAGYICRIVEESPEPQRTCLALATEIAIQLSVATRNLSATRERAESNSLQLQSIQQG